jgi:hypothetical protein
MDQNYNVALGTEIEDTPPPEVDPQFPTPPSLVDTEIRDMILKRQRASRDYYQPRREWWDKCWNHYKQVTDRTNKEAWQSDIFAPASPKVAEVITSNMHAAQLAPEQPVEYQARQPRFEDVVRDVNDIMAVDMDRSQFKVHWTDIIRSKVIIGTGIGKVEYRKEYATVKVKERVQETPLTKMADMARQMMGLPPSPKEIVKEVRMTVKDHAYTKYVDRYDCFPEPGTTEISKDRWFIERGKICNYKLLELAEDPDNPVINITPEMLSSTPKDLKDPDGDKSEKHAALDENVSAAAYMDPDQEHELLEYWGPAPIWMVQPEFYMDESRKYEMVHAWFWLTGNMLSGVR